MNRERHRCSGLHAAAAICLVLLLASFQILGAEVDGHLRTVGGYPFAIPGRTVTELSDGRVLVYGAQPSYFVQSLTPPTTQQLRERLTHGLSGPPKSDPLLWDPVRRGWSLLDPAPECRRFAFLHTATALRGGKLLIAGGSCDDGQILNDPKPHAPHIALSLWDGASGTWETAPTLAGARIYHSASLLADGSVLIAGGIDDPALDRAGEPVLNRIERFAGGEIRTLAPLHQARARHSATVLSDGRVLLVGGFDAAGAAMADVEVWDPRTQISHVAASLRVARYEHTATRLTDGRVLVAGGLGREGHALVSVELWDPAKDSWETQAALLWPVAGHSTALLADGGVLLMGGRTFGDGGASPVNAPMLRAMRRDSLSGEWQPAGERGASSWQERLANTLSLLPRADGSVQVFAINSILQWLPKASSVRTLPPHGGRTHFSATVTADGRILVAGGRSGEQFHAMGNVFHSGSELLDPSTGRYEVSGRLAQARSNHEALRLDDGRILVVGGWTRSPERPLAASSHTPEIWDPASGDWSDLAELRFEPEEAVTAAQLDNSEVLFLASRELTDDWPGALRYRAWTWNVRTGAILAKAVPVSARAGAGRAILPDGRVLIAGGEIPRFVAAIICAAAQRAAVADDEGDGCREEPAHWERDADSRATIWDSRSGAVRDIDPLPGAIARKPHTRVLRNGDVLLTDRQSLNPYDPNQKAAAILLLQAAAGHWRLLPPLPEFPSWPIVELGDGSLATLRHRLPPEGKAWQPAPSPPQDDPELLATAAGELLSLSATTPHLATYDSESSSWRLRLPSDQPPPWRSRPALLALSDGRLLAIGQVRGGAESRSAYTWDPRKDRWRSAGRLPRRTGDPAALAALPSGRVIYLAYHDSTHLACQIGFPEPGDWSECGALSFQEPAGRLRITLAPLADGRVALLSGRELVMVFNEETNAWTRMLIEWSSEPLSYGAPIRPDKPLARVFDAQRGQWIEANVLAARAKEQDTGAALSPRLLWDAQRRQLSYVFQQTAEGIGRDALLLSDGCALSGPPFRLFDAASGGVRRLENPAPGIAAQQGSLALLADDLIVVAGVGAPAEPGFFRRKVSCKGFAAAPDDLNLVPEAPSEPALAAGTTPPRPAAAMEATGLLRNQVWDYRWIAAAVLACLLAAGLLLGPLRRWAWPLAGTRRGWMNATVPVVPRLLLRVLVYGGLALIALPPLAAWLRVEREQDAADCEAHTPHCLDRDSGILRAEPSLGDEGRQRPAISCRFVGVWSSSQVGSVHRVVLDQKGRYRVSSNLDGRTGRIYTGHWAVQGANMVWHADEGSRYTDGADINSIVEQSEDAFTLIEANASRTRFKRIERLPADECAP